MTDTVEKPIFIPVVMKREAVVILDKVLNRSNNEYVYTTHLDEVAFLMRSALAVARDGNPNYSKVKIYNRARRVKAFNGKTHTVHNIKVYL